MLGEHDLKLLNVFELFFFYPGFKDWKIVCCHVM